MSAEVHASVARRSSIGSAPTIWHGCEAVRAPGALTAVEFSGVDETYAWARVARRTSRAHQRVLSTRMSIAKPAREVARARARSARRGRLQASSRSPGWSHPGALAALLWCLRNGRPARADVRQRDAMTSRRRAARSDQAPRRPALRGALVGGAPHSGVRLRRSGSRRRPSSTATMPWTTSILRAARGRPALGRERWRAAARAAGALLPRLQPLRRQEEPAAAARRLCGLSAARWSRRLASGALGRRRVARRESRAASPRPDLAGAVILAGFRQYDELPAWYGLAQRLRPRQHDRAVGPRGQRGDGVRPAGARLRPLRLCPRSGRERRQRLHLRSLRRRGARRADAAASPR